MTDSKTAERKMSGVEKAFRERKVTLVFDEDAGVFKGNPFKIETPYGTPCTVARGDMCEHADALEELCHALADAIEGRSKSDMDDALKLYREMFETPA